MSRFDDDVLARLSAMIDEDNPRLAEFLYRRWGDMQNAITYKELREAILSGELPLEYLLQWQQDYSLFVSEVYAPIMRTVCEKAAADLVLAYGGFLKDKVFEHMDRFIEANGARLVREISTAQYNAINVLVRQAAMTDTMTVDKLARSIRPCVGLTRRQAQTVKRYYDQLIEQGVKPSTALKRQAVYAAKVHRRRAATIAQTETAFAYENAQAMMMQEAEDEGLIGLDSTKTWLTALDERVCDVCGALEGETVPRAAAFSNGLQAPPGHPLCRCAIRYNLTKPTANVTKKASDPDAYLCALLAGAKSTAA